MPRTQYYAPQEFNNIEDVGYKILGSYRVTVLIVQKGQCGKVSALSPLNNMEVDDTHASASTHTDAHSKHIAASPVQLKEDDPFDLDQYIAQYAGQ